MSDLPVVIGVDCSTTGAKAVAFDADGAALTESRRQFPRRSPRPGWQEQDPQDWWTAVREALTELAAQLQRDDRRPVALSVTHQRETFACLDSEGAALRPAVMWLDTRAGQQIARLGNERVHEVSGKPASTTPSLYKLAWLAEHEPEVLRSARTVVDVHGFLVGHLTGVRATSWASADPMSLVDMRTFDWSRELVATAGLHVEQLPRLVPPGEVIGELGTEAATVTGLPAGLPVVAGAGDGQCAGLGAGLNGAGTARAYLNLGTGMTLGTHGEEYLWSRAFRTLASPMAGAYTFEALLSSGALSIAWLRDLLAGDGPVDDGVASELAAGVPPGARGLLFLPYLTSAESPHWDADARACFLGLSDGHGRAELTRAVFEGLAYEERLSLQLIEQTCGSDVREVVVMGGASRSPVFTQLLADVLERPVGVSASVETTALGAAILAAAAVGLDGTGDVAAVAERMSRVATVREPDPSTAGRYRDAFAVYRELYPTLRPLFGRLSALRQG